MTHIEHTAGQAWSVLKPGGFAGFVTLDVTQESNAITVRRTSVGPFHAWHAGTW